MKIILSTEQEMSVFAEKVARAIRGAAVIFLEGPLGVGKTTFARGFLHGLGYQGKVKSPTYTLVEPYQLADKTIFHFDLYRLQHANELEQIGIRDYFTQASICLIEWPEKGLPVLPEADIIFHIKFYNEKREIQVEAKSEKGREICGGFF